MKLKKKKKNCFLKLKIRPHILLYSLGGWERNAGCTLFGSWDII